MSRRSMIAAIVLVLLDGYLAFRLVQTLAATRPLPPEVSGSAGAGVAVDREVTASTAPTPLSSFEGTVARNLFHAERREAAQAAALPPPQPALPKPSLHGVVLTPAGATAYLEDPTTKKVYGYRVGDQVAGGRVDAIHEDRVKIQRGTETFDVLLRDPSKVRAAAAPIPAAPRRVQPPTPPSIRPGPVPPPPPAAPPPVRRLPQRPTPPEPAEDDD